MMCWIVTPQARGEMDPDSVRQELVRSDRLKDSLYNKAFGEAQAKYNAELGNDQLQEETRLVSRSRIYIIIICTVLLAAAVVLVVRQRRLIALQKQRLSEETKTLEELKLHYEHQQQDGIGNDAASELSEQDKQFLSKTMTIIDNQIESNSVNVDDIALGIGDEHFAVPSAALGNYWRDSTELYHQHTHAEGALPAGQHSRYDYP